MAEAFVTAEIAALARQVADLEARPSGTPEAEAVRARVMARFEELVGRVEKEFGGEPAAARQAICPHSDGTLRQAFDVYDTDKSGFLENDEIVALAQKLGAKKEMNELRAAIADMDTSNDGKVSFDEFAVFMRNEGAGKIATKLRAKLLQGKLGEQFHRIKSVANKAGAKSSSPPEGVERQFDIAVSVGGMQPDEETPVRGDFQVTATPRAEIPDAEWEQSLALTLMLRDGVAEDAVTACIEQMTGLYDMVATELGSKLRGFNTQQVDGKLVVVIKADPEELVGLLDKMVFFNGAPGAASLQATGKTRTNIDYEKLVAATLESPFDITKSGKSALQFVATVSNDTWFENLVNTVQQAGCDSDDEGEGGGSAEEKFAKLSFLQKIQKKVLPKFAWWMSGLRARFAFSSMSEFLGKVSEHGPKNAKILTGWTRELGHYQFAKKFCDDGPPPEEPYRAITAVVGGPCKVEVGVKCGHGDFRASADLVGLGRIMELLPPYEMCVAAAAGALEKPSVPGEA